MPEASIAPFTMSFGRPKSLPQSQVTMQLDRCPPDEWPVT